MDYFRSMLAGGGEGETSAEEDGSVMVSKLCDRLESSSLLTDRRDAARALKAISRKYRGEVSNRLDLLLTTLLTDKSDTEIASLLLETLFNVTWIDELSGTNVSDEEVGELTERIVQCSGAVAAILQLTGESEYSLRWSAVKLLTALLVGRQRQTQEMLLAEPNAVSSLSDLLSDRVEVVRNDTLLLLKHLSHANSTVQKILAFENGFDKLLDIVETEGYLAGDVVVEDSLTLLVTLLKNNQSNQTLFKEGSYIGKLIPIVESASKFQSLTGVWPEQRVRNLRAVLHIVRCLVWPAASQNHLVSCQDAILRCGLLKTISALLLQSGMPAEVLVCTIETLAQCIRARLPAQQFLSGVEAPSAPPRPVLVVLLMSMISDKQLFPLRAAILYCLQCYLHKNPAGQESIVKTLLPSLEHPIDPSSAGQLICTGLFNVDSVSCWLAAISLLHTISDNPQQKTELLRVQLASGGAGSQPVTLLKHLINTVLLKPGVRLQSRAGVLQLLIVWLARCPPAMEHFLADQTHVSYLVSQLTGGASDNQELLIQSLCGFLLALCRHQAHQDVAASLSQLVEHRVGAERFLHIISQVSQSEWYSRAGSPEAPQYSDASQPLLDSAFLQLHKALEHELVAVVDVAAAEEMKRLRADYLALQQQAGHFYHQLEELARENAMLKQQAANGAVPIPAEDSSQSSDDASSCSIDSVVSADTFKLQQMERELKTAREHCTEYSNERDQLLQRLAKSNQEILEWQQRHQKAESARQAAETELATLRGEQDDLLMLLAEQDTKLGDLRLKLRQLGVEIPDDDEDSEEDDTSQ